LEKPYDKKRLSEYINCISYCQKKSSIPKHLQDVKKIYDETRQSYNLPSISRKDISGNPIKELINHLVASIETNIQLHFFKRQLRYIMLRDNLDKKDAKKKQNEINKQIGNTNDDSLPFLIEKSVAYDLKVYPERFLYPMWIMNCFFSSKQTWNFSLLPLSTGFIDGSVLSLDTTALLCLIPSKKRPKKDKKNDKKESEQTKESEKIIKKRKAPGRDNDPEAMDEKDKIWKPFFNIDSIMKYKTKGVRFGHHITTDGVSVSIQLIYPGKQTISNKKKKASKEKINIPINIDLKKIIGVDPGKHEIVHMTNEDSPSKEKGVTLKYTSAQRRHESG